MISGRSIRTETIGLPVPDSGPGHWRSQRRSGSVPPPPWGVSVLPTRLVPWFPVSWPRA